MPVIPLPCIPLKNIEGNQDRGSSLDGDALLPPVLVCGDTRAVPALAAETVNQGPCAGWNVLNSPDALLIQSGIANNSAFIPSTSEVRLRDRQSGVIQVMYSRRVTCGEVVDAIHQLARRVARISHPASHVGASGFGGLVKADDEEDVWDVVLV